MIIRDHIGDVLASTATRIYSIVNATHTEAMEMWKALELARDIELSHFVLESDCQVLVQ